MKHEPGENRPRRRDRGVYPVRLILAVSLLCLLFGAGLQLFHGGAASPVIGPGFLSEGTMHGFPDLFRGFAPGSGRFWMQFGLMLILAAQVLRLAVVAWSFIKAREVFYVLMTLFLTGLVLHSFFL